MPPAPPTRGTCSYLLLLITVTTVAGCAPSIVVRSDQIRTLVGVDDAQVIKLAASGRYEYNNAILAAAQAGDRALLEQLIAMAVPPWRSIMPAYMAGSPLELALLGAARGDQQQIVDYVIPWVNPGHVFGEDQISMSWNVHGTAADVAHVAGHEALANYLVHRYSVPRLLSDQEIRDAQAKESALLASVGATIAAGPTPADMANAYAAGANAANAATAARGGQPTITNALQGAPVQAAPPIYMQNQNRLPGTSDGQFDRGLVSCIQLDRDDSGYYFQNNCGVQANIYYSCVDAGTGSTGGTANVNPLPGQRSAAPCFLPRSKTLWVACPNNDGIFGADGNSTWQPGGPYTCKRVWGR
jgi:hypothetical protein